MAQEEPFEIFTSVRYGTALRGVPSNALFSYAGWNSTQSSPFYMLNLHRDRLVRACRHFGWEKALSTVVGDEGFQNLERVLQDAVRDNKLDGNSGLRCRVTLSEDGQLKCEAFPASDTALVGLFPPRLPAPGFMTVPERGKEPDDWHSPLKLSLRTEVCNYQYEVTVDLEQTEPSEFTRYKTTRRQVYDDARRRAGITGPERKEVLLVNTSGAIMDGTISTVYFYRNGRWVTPPVPPRHEQENNSGGLGGTTRRWALARGLAVEQEVLADSVQDGEECWLSNGVRGFLFARIKLSPRK